MHQFINLVVGMLAMVYELDFIQHYSVQRDLRAPLAWTPSNISSPAVEELRKGVNYPLCGVLVFWAPFQSGKTFALKDLTKLLQNEGKTVKYVNAKTMGKHSSFSIALRSAIGMSKTTGEIDERLSGSLLIIDHFENVMHYADAQGIVTGLAQESREKRTFTVLLGMSSSYRADEVLWWNGGSKFRLACGKGCGRWPANLTATYVKEFPMFEEVLELVTQMGSVGKIEEVALANLQARKEIAQNGAKEWDEGIKVLDQWYRLL